MTDERLFERLATHAGPAEFDVAFEDRLYSVLQREMRRPGRSSRPALLLVAALLAALAISAVVGSGLIEPPWADRSVIPTPSATPSSSPAFSLPPASASPTPSADELGLIAFARDGDIFTMQTDGRNVRRIVQDAGMVDRPLAWLTDGSRLAILSDDGIGYSASLSLVAPDGSNRTQLGTVYPVYSPQTWSPDGTKIAFTSDGSPGHGVAVLDLTSGELRQLTTDGGAGRDAGYGPLWSPDATKIAYLVNGPQGGDVWLVDVVSGFRVNLSQDAASLGPIAWIADHGRDFVMYDSYRGVDINTGSQRNWIVDANGGDPLLLSDSGLEVDPLPPPIRLAPDGQSMVYHDSQGRFTVQGTEGSTRAWPAGVVLDLHECAALAFFGPSWSADAAYLAFAGTPGEAHTCDTAWARDIFVVRLTLNGEPVLTNLTNTPQDEGSPAWQPAAQ